MQQKFVQKFVQSVQNGVQIWIDGARIHRDSPRGFEDGVEAFWRAAFSRRGANAPVEHFAPTLRDFPTNPRLVKLLTDDQKPLLAKQAVKSAVHGPDGGLAAARPHGTYFGGR